VFLRAIGIEKDPDSVWKNLIWDSTAFGSHANPFTRYVVQNGIGCRDGTHRPAPKAGALAGPVPLLKAIAKLPFGGLQ